VSRLKFLADMNLSPLTVAALKVEQYDIERVSSLLPATAADSVILELARQGEYVVITQDLDFSSLLALGGYAEPSLVTLRLTNTDPDFVTQRLRQVLPEVEQRLSEGCAITVDDVAVRIRKLPIR
jgi:predicted nuclease of predicted toxin-antitoxin system